MGNISTLTLNDAVPASHSFEPTMIGKDLVTYHDKVSGVFAGYPSISLGHRMPTAQNGNYKVTLRVRIPVLETAATAASGFTPGPTVAYSLNANIDFIVPDRSTAAERADLVAYVKNLLADSVVSDSVEDMDNPY
jgi:hypothetical protein